MARSKEGLHGAARSQRGKTYVWWCLLISEALKNIKTTHCPTLFGLLPSVPPQIHRLQKSSTPPTKKKQKKTATYQQRECTQWFIHSFKRTWNLGSISVPASLCVRCTAEQRDLVGLSSLIFLLVFLCVFSLSLSPLSLSQWSFSSYGDQGHGWLKYNRSVDIWPNTVGS